MKLDDIDFDALVEICEGNEDTAELLQRFIRENPAASPEVVRKHVNEWLNTPRSAGLASRGPA